MRVPRKSPPSKPQSKPEQKLDEELEESFPPAIRRPIRQPRPAARRGRSVTHPASQRDAADRRRQAPIRLLALRRCPDDERSPVVVAVRLLGWDTFRLLTTAERGPWRISAISASTAPSKRLQTQPVTPSLSAARR